MAASPDRIAEVLKTMLRNKELISRPIYKKEEREFYFLYDQKYKWSILTSPSGAEFTVYIYPGEENLQQVYDDWSTAEKISFSTVSLTDYEFRTACRALYEYLRDDYFGVERLFNEILQK